MSIKSQGHSLTFIKGHSDFKVKCLTFGLYTQVSDSGPQGPLVSITHDTNMYYGGMSFSLSIVCHLSEHISVNFLVQVLLLFFSSAVFEENDEILS